MKIDEDKFNDMNFIIFQPRPGEINVTEILSPPLLMLLKHHPPSCTLSNTLICHILRVTMEADEIVK
jgi:hypothetical protein